MTDTGSPSYSRPEVPGRTGATGSALYQHLLRRIQGLGLCYGREDSFKLSHRQIIQNRVLIGINRADLPSQTMFEIAHELGMPQPCRELLAPHTQQANVVLFGIEDRADGSVCKLYLEFWDQVKQEVRRTGARTPLLLHLGVKWDSAHPGQHALARYTCHPLLSAQEAMQRMAGVYPPDQAAHGREAALAIVRQGVKRNRAASLLYLEVSEGDNPRCSFDINLYKTGLLIGDAAAELRQAASQSVRHSSRGDPSAVATTRTLPTGPPVGRHRPPWGRIYECVRRDPATLSPACRAARRWCCWPVPRWPSPCQPRGCPARRRSAARYLRCGHKPRPGAAPGARAFARRSPARALESA